MGLFHFFLGLFGWHRAEPSESRDAPPSPAPSSVRRKLRHGGRRPAARVRLVPLRRPHQTNVRPPLSELTVSSPPYAFSRLSVLGGFLDLSRDGDLQRLRQFGLPAFTNPVELAEWIGIS